MTDIKRRKFVNSAGALASFATLTASASSPSSIPSASAKYSSMKSSVRVYGARL